MVLAALLIGFAPPARVVSSGYSETLSDDQAIEFAEGTSLLIDISEGEFSGWNAEFAFQLPDEWYDNRYNRWMVEVRRVPYKEYMDVLDWFNIYHNGFYGLNLVAQLFVYERSKFSEGEATRSMNVIMQTEDYVFAASRYSSGGVMTEVDMDEFTAISQAVAANGALKRLITLGPGQTERFSQAVLVEGQALEAGAEIIDGVFYIPLRETCEALGYFLRWDQTANEAVVLSGEEPVDRLPLPPAESYPYPVRIIGDRSYVTAAYFADVLNKDIAVDGELNISLYK